MRPVVRPSRSRRTGGLAAVGVLAVAGTVTVLATAAVPPEAVQPTTTTTMARATNTAVLPVAAADDQEWSAQAAGSIRPVELAADQMPGAASEGWKSDGPVLARATIGHDIGFSECASARGSTSWIRNVYSAAAGQDTADQDTFTYGDSAEAEAAFTAAADEMQACQPIARTLQPANQAVPEALDSQAAVGSGAYDWTRIWDGIDGLSVAGEQTHRYYVLLHASTLVIVTVTEYAGSTSAPIDADANPRILTGLVIALDGQRTDTSTL